MARYCCHQCRHPIQFSAVFSAFLPHFIACNQCSCKVLTGRHPLAWGVFILFVLVILGLAVCLAQEGLSLVFIAVVLIGTSLMLEWVYFHALAHGWLSSSLVPAHRIQHSLPISAQDLEGVIHLEIPLQWQVKPEPGGYRAFAPDDSQCIYVKYLPRNSKQSPAEWAEDVRATLLATHYKPTVTRFVIYQEWIESDKAPYSVTLDGFDETTAYRLVTQQMQTDGGMVLIGLHQFSCQNYQQAVAEAAISLPLLINA